MFAGTPGRTIDACLLSAFLAFSMLFQSHAEDAPTAERLKPLVYTYFSTYQPDYNTNAGFKVRPVEVKGLWKGLGVEVFDAQIDEQWAPEWFFAYYKGKVTMLVGEYEALMSGLFSGGDFYYTWAGGSGIGRSRVGRLRIANGKLEIVQSSEFFEQEYRQILVSADPGRKVRLFSGDYRGHFNQCEASKSVGFVGGTNSLGQLQIIDAKGKVINPTL